MNVWIPLYKICVLVSLFVLLVLVCVGCSEPVQVCGPDPRDPAISVLYEYPIEFDPASALPLSTTHDRRVGVGIRVVRISNRPNSTESNRDLTLEERAAAEDRQYTQPHNTHTNKLGTPVVVLLSLSLSFPFLLSFSSSMGASVGKTVSLSSGDVTILKLIGEGGFAEIFLVRSERDKKIRALKRMVVAREDQEKHKIAKWEFQINVSFNHTRGATHPPQSTL